MKITDNEKTDLNKFIKSVKLIKSTIEEENLAIYHLHNFDDFKNGTDKRPLTVQSFSEYRKLLKENGNSIKNTISIIKKYNLDNSLAKDLLSIEKEFALLHGDIISGQVRRFILNKDLDVQENITNGDVIQDLESRFVFHSDGLRTPEKLKEIKATNTLEALHMMQYVAMVIEGSGMLEYLLQEAEKLAK